MTRPYIKMVVAYTKNRVIGRESDMPWHLPRDLAHFKRTTMGQSVIMGRKTWEIIGRPLPGRPNLVISRAKDYCAAGATVYSSLPAALKACEGQESVCVIGGGQIYEEALALADEVIATEIHANLDGDTYFPQLPADQWREIERQPQPEDNGHHYDFVVYRRQAAS